MPARYIQPAEPVYQVQPPRPTCGGDRYTSAHDDVGLDPVPVRRPAGVLA